MIRRLTCLTLFFGCALLVGHAAGQQPNPAAMFKRGDVNKDGKLSEEEFTNLVGNGPKLKANPAKYLVRLEPAPRGQVLSVPESAVVDTGTRKVVYVESEPGIYEGREVVLGSRSGDRFPVLEGLAPGEKVAAAGAFLIDAESRLNPAGTSAHSGDVPAPAHHIATRSNPTSVTAPHRH